MHDLVTIHDLHMQAIIGLLDHERVTPQTVCWQVELEVDFEGAADAGDLSGSVHYAHVVDALTRLAQDGRWRLLETAVVAAARLLLSAPAPCEHRVQVHSVTLRVSKPEILPSAVPGVAVRRPAAWLAEAQTYAPGVIVQPLVQVQEGGAWKLVLDANASWNPPANSTVALLAGEAKADANGLTRFAGSTAAGSLHAGPLGAALLLFAPTGAL